MQNVDFLKGLAAIDALKSNLDKDSLYTHEKYVKEYHDFISALAKDGLDVESFRIPEEEISLRVSSVNPRTGATYRPYREVETKLFLYKIDSLTKFLNLIMKPSVGGPMGFNQ